MYLNWRETTEEKDEKWAGEDWTHGVRVPVGLARSTHERADPPPCVISTWPTRTAEQTPDLLFRDSRGEILFASRPLKFSSARGCGCAGCDVLGFAGGLGCKGLAFRTPGDRGNVEEKNVFSSRTIHLKIINVEKKSLDFHWGEFDHQLFGIDRLSSFYLWFLSRTVEDNRSREEKFGFPLGRVRLPAFQDQQALLSLPPVHQ